MNTPSLSLSSRLVARAKRFFCAMRILFSRSCCGDIGADAVSVRHGPGDGWCKRRSMADSPCMRGGCQQFTGFALQRAHLGGPQYDGAEIEHTSSICSTLRSFLKSVSICFSSCSSRSSSRSSWRRLRANAGHAPTIAAEQAAAPAVIIPRRGSGRALGRAVAMAKSSRPTGILRRAERGRLAKVSTLARSR